DHRVVGEGGGALQGRGTRFWGRRLRHQTLRDRRAPRASPRGAPPGRTGLGGWLLRSRQLPNRPRCPACSRSWQRGSPDAKGVRSVRLHGASSESRADSLQSAGGGGGGGGGGG